MTEQTIQSRPAVQQASAPYLYEERIGGSWPQALTITALFTALAASLIFQAHLLNMVLIFCCVAFGFTSAVVEHQQKEPCLSAMVWLPRRFS